MGPVRRRRRPPPLRLGLPLGQAVEVQVIGGMRAGIRGEILNGLGDPPVHAFHCPVLPPEYLLDGRGSWITLWEHRDQNVGLERLSGGYFLHDLLGDLSGHDVHGQGVLIAHPRVGAAQEVLVLKVHELFRAPD